MIRWSYVLPRLVVGLGLLTVGYFGVDPAGRRLVTFFGHTILHAQLDLEQLNVGLLPPSVAAHGVQLAGKTDSEKNLFQASLVRGELELVSLLKKKVVINELTMEGVRIGGDHDARGENAAIEVPKLPDFDLAWLDDIELAFHHNLELDFETPPLIRHTAREWKRKYERLQTQARQLRTKAEGLVARFESPPTSPEVRKYFEIAAEAERLRTRLKLLQDELSQLPNSIVSDRRAINDAQRRDQERIRSRLELGALDRESLTEYLLGGEQAQMLTSLLSWLDWARGYMPSQDIHSRDVPSREEAKPKGPHRGVDLQFASRNATPDFLMKSAVMTGSIVFDGKERPFLGRIADVSDRPNQHTKPTTLLLKLVDEGDVMIRLTLDRTGDTPRERIQINAPTWRTKERVFGNPDKLAITVAPSELYFWLDVEAIGNELRGSVVTQAHDLVLSPSVGGRLEDSPVLGQLQQAVREIKGVETRLVLSGDIDNPRFKIESDIGNRLQTVIAGVFQNELARRRNELAAGLSSSIEHSLAQFDQQIRQSQKQASDTIMAHESFLADLSRRALYQRQSISSLTGGRFSIPNNFGR